MSLFDPLGFASPVTIGAKRILQHIWRRGTGWDERIPQDLAEQWTKWITHLIQLKDVKIPRAYSLHYSNATSLQLHIFVDASEEAYAAIAYWRASTTTGVDISLVAAKAKVCPLKLTSIPRLELQAAVMGSRLSHSIIEEHDIKPESTTYWTDSKTVLTWLKTGARSYRPFVAHRIAAIEENSTLSDWRWVPTKLNVADDATRDVPIDFNKQHRWFTGPSFLRDDPSTWPTERPTIETPTGEERVHLVISNVATYNEAVPDPKRFSKWKRLLRSTARILQFIDLCRPAHKTCYGYRRNRKNQQTDADWNSKNTKKKIAPGSSLRIKNVQQERRFKNIESEHLRRAEELLVRV
ncbi:unnamed protein product [Colias eurytheme]|nr:unnamed protein product [Colias eurytheme]